MKMNITKWISTGLMTVVFGAGVAMADDSELKATTDTSHNPITGTVTVKKTFKNKKTQADGAKSSKETVQTKKYKTDGSVESKKTTETSAQSGE